MAKAESVVLKLYNEGMLVYINKKLSFDDLKRLVAEKFKKLENFFNGRFTSVFREEASELKPHELYEAIRDGFGDKLGKHDVLVAALCTALHTQQELTAEKLNNFKRYVVESKEQIRVIFAGGLEVTQSLV